MHHEPLLLGLDLGSSALKCVLVDAGGRSRGQARVEYASLPVEGGGCEQDPHDWWRALARGIGRVVDDSARARVVAIGLAGHAPSPVFVDGDLEPVASVAPWFDPRPKRYWPRLLECVGDARAGDRLTLETAARALCVRAQAPGTLERARHVLQGSDYLASRLVGQAVSSSALDRAILELAGLEGALVVQASPPGSVVGELGEDAASELGLPEGIPVVACGVDTFTASIGSGARAAGDACVSTGSSSVAALLTTPRLTTCPSWAGHPIVSRQARVGGRLLETVSALVAPRGCLDRLISKAAETIPSRWLDPWEFSLLEGDERETRANLARLAASVSTERLVHAVLSAIVLAQRSALENLEAQTARAIRLRSVGRVAQSAAFVQLQADVFGREIEVPEAAEPGALGAAIVAAVAAGIHTPENASNSMTRISWSREPRPIIFERFEQRRPHFARTRTHFRSLT